LDVFFACSKIGAVHLALNFRLNWKELLEIFIRTTPRILIFADDFCSTVEQVLCYFPLMTCHLDGPGLPNSLHFETALQSMPDMPVTCEALEAEDIAALIFTGGTTGSTKAAEISHRMIAWNTLNTVIHDLTHNDIYLNVFPMFHTGGLFVYTLPQVIFGGTTIIIRQFEPVKVLTLLQREKVTVIVAAPTIYQMLTTASNWPEADLSSLRFCQSGGASVPVPLVEKYAQEKGVHFRQGFGMTEFGPGIFSLASEDAITKAGSIGRPNFFVDAKIMDDDQRLLEAGQTGELVLKGPSSCSGYFNDLDANENATDAYGYFHTGDLASYDDEGYFYIVDRKKDMFISGGENVYPVEIEKALYQHPAVHICAVIGIPDEKWGEIGKACVVLKPGQSVSEAELLDFLISRLAKYKVPKTITFMESLPISPVGKILKRELRVMFSR
jgi:fatty-acyl-CoA synthase